MDVAEWPTAHSRHEALVPHLGDDTGLMGTTRDMLDVECTHTHTHTVIQWCGLKGFKCSNSATVTYYINTVQTDTRQKTKEGENGGIWGEGERATMCCKSNPVWQSVACVVCWHSSFKCSCSQSLPNNSIDATPLSLFILHFLHSILQHIGTRAHAERK